MINQFTFGVEFECILPRGMSHVAAAQQVTLAGVECNAERYGHSAPRAWKVVGDGSLGDYISGAEFVSPVLQGDEGFRQVTIVCNALKAMGARVTKRCGLHVHVGARHETPSFFKNLAASYAQYQGVIDSFLPPSRRGNANLYCKDLRVNTALLNSATDLRSIQVATGAVGQGDRYWKLNLAAWFRHGTVEFRHHHGTVEAEKALHWIRFCLRMAVRAKAMPSATVTVAAPYTGRDRWHNTVVDMLCRAEGATREEIMQVTGQSGARIPRRASIAGLIIVKRRRVVGGQVQVRIYGRRPSAATVTVAPDQPATLDGLMAFVGASAEEHTYFARRASALR